MEWSDVVRHLTGLAHLATVTPDGRPHVSIVAPGVDGDTVWIGTTATSVTARNLTVMPSAALVWQPGAEVYVQADVEFVDDPDVKQRVWDAGVFPFDPAMFWGTADHPGFVLLRLAPTAATIMEHTEDGPTRRRWVSGTARTSV